MYKQRPRHETKNINYINLRIPKIGLSAFDLKGSDFDMQAGINLNDACSQEQILQCLIGQQKVPTWLGSITAGHFYNFRKNNRATSITTYQENCSFQAGRFRAGTALVSIKLVITKITSRKSS